MEKDGTGGSTGEDAALDALLSAADRGMLDAIRDNLDLDTGFAQILGDLAGITPTGPPTRTAEAEPRGHAHSYSHARDPVLACEVSRPAHMIRAPADPSSPREPLYHHGALLMLALAVVAALDIAVLFGLSQSHRAVGAQSRANATNPASRAIAGERPAGRPRRVIVLGDRVGATASLRFAADSAGIGGDPVISYLGDSRRGPVLLLSGLPAGAAVRLLSIGAGQSCRNCFTVSDWIHPFPSGGEQFSPGTMIWIAGDNGRVILDTVQNPASGQIGVTVTWSSDLL